MYFVKLFLFYFSFIYILVLFICLLSVCIVLYLLDKLYILFLFCYFYFSYFIYLSSVYACIFLYLFIAYVIKECVEKKSFLKLQPCESEGLKKTGGWSPRLVCLVSPTNLVFKPQQPDITDGTLIHSALSEDAAAPAISTSDLQKHRIHSVCIMCVCVFICW